MRTIADGYWAADRFGKLDDKTAATVMPAFSAAAVPQGLKLQCAKIPFAILAEGKRAILFKELSGNFRTLPLRIQCQQAEQIMRGGAGLPAIRIHLEAAIAKGFGMARGNERRQ